jgi:hypothetical protein
MSIKLFSCILLIFAGGIFVDISAQPSDAQIKKDLTGAKTVSVSLGAPGQMEWSKTYKKFAWTRSFTAKVKSDYPDIFVVVKGYAMYDVMGGKYVFTRSFITSNSYDGIPDPTAADVQGFINKFGVEQFIGNYDFNHIIGKIESLGLADEPKFTWHTPNSVSFNVVAVYTKRTNDVGGRERIARTYEIRLYRDDVKAPWKNLNSTPREVKKL